MLASAWESSHLLLEHNCFGLRNSQWFRGSHIVLFIFYQWMQGSLRLARLAEVSWWVDGMCSSVCSTEDNEQVGRFTLLLKFFYVHSVIKSNPPPPFFFFFFPPACWVKTSSSATGLVQDVSCLAIVHLKHHTFFFFFSGISTCFGSLSSLQTLSGTTLLSIPRFLFSLT